MTKDEKFIAEAANHITDNIFLRTNATNETRESVAAVIQRVVAELNKPERLRSK